MCIPRTKTAATGPKGEIIEVLATVAPFIPAPFVVANSICFGQLVKIEMSSEMYVKYLKYNFLKTFFEIFPPKWDHKIRPIAQSPKIKLTV